MLLIMTLLLIEYFKESSENGACDRSKSEEIGNLSCIIDQCLVRLSIGQQSITISSAMKFTSRKLKADEENQKEECSCGVRNCTGDVLASLTAT
jgi:hypothetical protein